jgi:hypothetical protein
LFGCLTKKWTKPFHSAIHCSGLSDYSLIKFSQLETHMAKLPRYSLAHDDKSKRWVLKHEGTGKSVKTFGTKAAATKGGVLEKAVGGKGSVRIRKRNGKIQEERTYPRSADPRGSRG